MIKYVLHPDFIHNDYGHKLGYISYLKLIKLYKLNFKECICWDYMKPWFFKGKKIEDYKHLFVREDGNYKL